MPSIAELRNMYPDAKNASDEEIIGWVAKRSNISLSDAARYFDYDLSGGQTSKRFGASIDRYQAGLYGTGEALAGVVGLDSASNYLAKQRQQNEAQANISSERAKELGAVESFKDVNSIGDFGNYAVGLGIQSAPYLAEALVGGVLTRGAMTGTRAALTAAEAAGDVAAAVRAKRALNIGSSAGVVGATYPSSVGDVLSNQREQAGKTDAASAFALGVPYAALNVLGVEGALGKGQLFRNSINFLDNVPGAKGVLARTTATGTVAAGKEGTQETLQETVNQAGRMAVDPTEQFFNEKSIERFKESFAGGATLGGIIGGGAGGWRRSESFVPGSNTGTSQQTGQQTNNDIQQAFQQTNTGTTPTNTGAPPTAIPVNRLANQMGSARVDPLAGRSSLYNQQPASETTTTPPITPAPAPLPLLDKPSDNEPSLQVTVQGRLPSMGGQLLGHLPISMLTAPENIKRAMNVLGASTQEQFVGMTIPLLQQRGNVLSETEVREILGPQAAPAAPAVSGGTTAIAQQNQQQTQAAFAAQQQQKEAERASYMAEQVGLPKPDGQRWDFFGKPIFGPAAQEAAKATADLVGASKGFQNQITRAINVANQQTGGKLVNVNFNPLKAADSVRKTFEKVAEVAARFQIAHVGSVEEAAQILEQLSQSTKGAQLEQLNAIHQALTGKDTTGYIASQQTKGATNEQQLQTTTGMGTVPVQSGTGESSSGVAGNVQPGRLQSLISGSQPQGQTVEQIGQSSGEGIRPSTSVTSDISSGQLTTGQVSEAAPATQEAAGQTAPVALAETPSEPSAASAEVDQGVATQAAVDEIESKLDNIPDLIRNVLRMVFPKARPQTIELYATFASEKAGFNRQTDSFEKIAQELNKMFPGEKPLKASTIKDYVNKDLKLDENGIPLFISRERVKIMAAMQFQADKAGVSVDTLLTGLTTVLENSIAESEEAGIVDEMDLILNGMQIQNRSERTNVEGEKTGKSDLKNTTNIVDENNKSDTLNQKYTVLMEEMVKALEANDESKIAKLQTEIADVVGKIRKEVKLEQGRTRAKAGKVKAEKEEKALTGEVSPTGEDIGERATTTEADEKVEAAPKEQLTEEEVEAEQEEEAKPKSLGEKLAEESSAKRKVERKGLAVGDTVVNPKLGTGVVEGFSGNGAETIVTVKFQSGVTKNLSVALAKLEKTNAVQAGSGVAVAKEEIKPAKPVRKTKQVKAKVEAPVEVKAEEVKTPEEAAEAAWNKVADTMPSAPKFADLTKTQREDFIDFGPENWTEADVTLELVKLAKTAPVAKAAPATEIVTEKRQTISDVVAETEKPSRVTVTPKTVLDTNKFVYHAVRSDEDIETIMRDGIAPGTNVSTTHDGQAFSGEGDTILVLPKGEAGAKDKGYQQDSVTSAKVFPVAILKDDSLLPAKGDVTEDELLNEEEEIRNALAAFDKTLGITEDQRISAITKAEVGNKAIAKQLFGDFYDRIMKLSRRQDVVWDELDSVEQRNALPTLESYTQYEIPVFPLDIQYNENTDKVKLKVEEQVEAPAKELTAEEIIEESPEAAEINPEQQAILEEPVAALPEAQVVRLENHYGVKRGTSEFFTKLQEDVTAYATKGAQAVAAAIRDIVKAIHAGVLATAMIFNPSVMTKNSEVVIVAPRTVSQVREVRAEVPAAAKANMSKAAQEAYSTIYPSIAAKLKADNKFFVLTDKPNAQMFIFNPDGSLFLQKKVLIGKTVGDYYKGNTDIVQNRITPAGLFTMGLRDAKRGGGEARTAGDYDFGKVFVLDKAINGEYSVTLFHSVWTKEKDAQQRLAALQKEGAADSRYSFGCINVDKATYGSLVANNLQQMDGAALFIVPDKQELVGEFLTGPTAQNKANKDELTRTPFTPKTETVTTTIPAPAQGQATPSKVSMVGREEDVKVGKMNAMRGSLTPDQMYFGQQEANLTAKAEDAQARVDEEQAKVDSVKEKIARGISTNQRLVDILVEQTAWFQEEADKAKVKLEQVREHLREIGHPRFTKTSGAMQDVGKMNAMRTFDVTDLDGTLTHMEETDLNKLERFPGVANAINKYRADGMENVLAAVDGWYTTNDDVNWDGSFTALNGKPSIIYRSGSMTSEANTEWTTHHEIGHAVDQAHLDGGGLFSGMSLFNVRIVDGNIKPMGAIMQELYDHYINNPNSKLSQVLQYPFNRKKHSNLDANAVREEVFAQLWATFNTRDGNQFLEDELPNVYDLMELIYDEVKQTNYAKAGNIQAAQTQTVGQTAYRNDQSRQVPGSTNPVPFRAIRRETVDETINRLPPFVRTSTRSLTTTLLNQAKNAVYASAITEDVVKMASKYMKSANDYLNAQYARQATRIQFEQRINKILSDFDKLSGEYKGTGANSVNKFIKDSTVSGKWGYYPGEHRVGTKLFTVDPDMKLRFDAFDESAQKVIKDVFEHGYEALMLKKKAVEAAIDREFADREKAVMGDTEQMEELAKEKKLLLAREAKVRGIDVSSPYAYLGRYGDYVVVAKSAEFKHYEERVKLNDWDVKQAKQWLEDNISNADHYVVQFAETQAEADVIADQLHATGNYDIMPEDAGVKEAEESYTGGGDIHLAVSRLRNLLQRQVSDGDMSSVNFHSMNKMVGDLYLMTVAEASARKSEMQRKNVAGADDNMMRNLATSGRADAHFLSTLEHNDAITDSMERMRSEAKNHRREAMPIYNELVKRQANSMEYKSPSVLSVALNRMNTIWSLTFSPAYYLQQTLQTAVISVPYLAGRLGYSNAVAQVNRGYKDIASLVKGLGVNDHIDFSKAPADVRDMLNKLVGMGKIDISMDANERATADEKGILAKVMYKMQGVNNRIEAVNRSVAAIAAYRGYLARYGNNNTEAATQYAAQVVSDTHGSYDGFNTPRALAGNIGRVVGQFRRFQIIQLSMLARLMHNAFKGASADEKMVARKALGFITAQMTVIGGAMAVPFVSQIAWMMSKILGDPDEPDDFEFKLRRLIDNKVAADLLLRGVPAALGVDVSDKLGMGRVASILPFSQGDLTSRSGAEKILVAAMGPSASMSMKFADAFGMILKGDYYKGLEMALPNGFANVMKAGRFTTEGITMRNGDLVLKPEDFSVVDTAFQAVGLPTNTVTDRQFTQQVKAEYDKFYAQRSTDIKGDYVKAYRDNDAKGMAQAREEFQQMEDSRVANGYKRQPMSDLLKAPMAAMKRERGVIGGVETSKQNRRFVELASQI